jgi:hypothetical protein
MKKVFIFITIIAISFGLKAQEDKVAAFITPSGSFEYSGEIVTAGTKEDLQKKVKDWFMTTYTNYSKDAIIDGDIEQGNFTIRGTFQNKQTYNPFAGSYFENTTYLFRVNVEEEKINYKIFGVNIKSTYVGWGANKDVIEIGDIIEKLTTAKIKLAELEQDKKSSKKEMKELRETVKEETEHLESIVNPLMGIINSFEKGMNR